MSFPMRTFLTVLIAVLIYGLAVGLRFLGISTTGILISEITVGIAVFFILKLLNVFKGHK
jgi:hypothetical protein